MISLKNVVITSSVVLGSLCGVGVTQAHAETTAPATARDVQRQVDYGALNQWRVINASGYDKDTNWRTGRTATDGLFRSAIGKNARQPRTVSFSRDRKTLTLNKASTMPDLMWAIFHIEKQDSTIQIEPHTIYVSGSVDLMIPYGDVYKGLTIKPTTGYSWHLRPRSNGSDHQHQKHVTFLESGRIRLTPAPFNYQSRSGRNLTIAGFNFVKNNDSRTHRKMGGQVLSLSFIGTSHFNFVNNYVNQVQGAGSHLFDMGGDDHINIVNNTFDVNYEHRSNSDPHNYYSEFIQPDGNFMGSQMISYSRHYRNLVSGQLQGKNSRLSRSQINAAKAVAYGNQSRRIYSHDINVVRNTFYSNSYAEAPFGVHNAPNGSNFYNFNFENNRVYGKFALPTARFFQRHGANSNHGVISYTNYARYQAPIHFFNSRNVTIKNNDFSTNNHYYNQQVRFGNPMGNNTNDGFSAFIQTSRVSRLNVSGNRFNGKTDSWHNLTRVRGQRQYTNYDVLVRQMGGY